MCEKWILLISCILVLNLSRNVQAEDLYPPDFAGGEQTGTVFWEFQEDSDQPTSSTYSPPYLYNPELLNPAFGFRYYNGAWQWQEGAGINGDGAMLLQDEESLVQPAPEGDGANITQYVQITWQGPGSLGIGLEIWSRAENWSGGTVFPGQYLGGPGIDPIEEYDLGDGWKQSIFTATFPSDDVTFVHVICHMDVTGDHLIDQVVVDMVVHDGDEPPSGPGRAGFQPELASNPNPADEKEDVPLDTVLSWTPGVYANKHNVYFGTSFYDVNDAGTGSPILVRPGQTATSYDPPGMLDWGQTYYWRIDEVNAPPDASVYRGQTWSFTAEPYTYPLLLDEQIIAVTASSYDPKYDPNNTINGSGLDSNDLHDVNEFNMWLTERNAPEPAWIQYEFDRVYNLHEMQIWNYNRKREDILGYGFKDVRIEYSMNGTDFTALDPIQLPPGTGEEPVEPFVVALDGITGSQVRLTAQSNFKGRSQYGLSEVRLLYLPVRARGPQPESGAVNVAPDTILRWRPGREAVSHEVYLGTDVNDLLLTDTVAASSIAPDGLVLDQTYHWQVNEVNLAETPSSWQGDLWRFTSASFLVVDDFEGYGNASPDRVFQTWVDGYGFSPDEYFPQGHPGNGTGSGLGHDIWTPGSLHYMGDLMETTTVHDGRQSAPLYYNGPSEITRTFNPPEDWTAAGIRALTLYVYGQQDNGNGRLYVKINNSPAKVIEDVDLTTGAWQEVNLDLADFNVNLPSMTNLTLGVDGSGTGMIFVDDVRLYPSRCLPEKVLGDVTGDCIVDAEDLAVIADNWLRGPLAAEYTFDTGLLDTSGNMRHAAGRNNPLVQNGVLTLNGSNAMDIPLGTANPFDGTRDFSVAMDFQTNDPGVLLSSARDDTPDNHAMAIYVDDDPDEPFWGEVVYDNFQVGWASAEDDEFFYEFNQWHSLVVTYDADSNWVTVYLDEVAGDGEQIQPSIPNVAADTVRAGSTLNTASPDVGDFVGSIDNVRIFNLTLTPDDVVLLPRIPAMPADVNRDGIVDQQDKDIVEANMGPVQLWP